MAPLRGPQAIPSDLAETQTLYVRNLNDKINKDRLRDCLYFTFCHFGRVLDVVAKKGDMKGQAFVSFEHMNSAINAKHALDGTMMLGKKMVVVYSRTASNKVKELKGTFDSVEKEHAPVKASSQAAKKSIFNDPSQLKKQAANLAPQTNGVADGEKSPGKRLAVEKLDGQPAEKRVRSDEDDGGEAPMEVDDEGGEMEMDESDSD